MSKKPEQVPAYFNMVKPFSVEVWLAVLLALGVTSVVFVAVRWAEEGTKGLRAASEAFMMLKLLFSQSKNFLAST